MIEEADDPFACAVKLAVAGSALDFEGSLPPSPERIIRRVFDRGLTIDGTDVLRAELAHAERVLCLGGSAGEPVLDGVMLEDARNAGIERWAELVVTGDNTSGVMWGSTSNAFHRVFMNADVVIAKGPEHLAGLIDMPMDVHCLLAADCERIATIIGVPRGSYVVWKMGVDTDSSAEFAAMAGYPAGY